MQACPVTLEEWIMIFRASHSHVRLAPIAHVCLCLIDWLQGPEGRAPRVASRGEADALPQPGVYALLAGFDRH